MTNQEREKTKRAVIKFRQEPDFFIEKILGTETLEEYQRLLCRLFAKHDKLAVKACHSVGKTFIMARLALAFLYCYKGAKVITTAPTHRQVVKLLWGEIRSAKNKATTFLDGKLLTNELVIDDDWYAMGFSPEKGVSSNSSEQQGSSFQGFHAPYILIIFDEATGISKDIYTMAEGLTTSGAIVKWVCIANPTSRSSEFFKICNSAEWYVHTINCFDSPNMIANGFIDIEKVKEELEILRLLNDTDRIDRIRNYKKPNSNLINAQFVMSKCYTWGLRHPLTLSKILGEFPESDDNTAVKYEHVTRAIAREYFINPLTDDVSIGVDVARYGDDLSVITVLQGKKQLFKEKIKKGDGTEVAGAVVAMIHKFPRAPRISVAVDATGIGSGVFDILVDEKRLKHISSNVALHEIHFGSSVKHINKEEEERLKKLYENYKAYIFDELDRALRDELDILDEEVYETELCSILIKYSRSGRLVIESKEEFKARLKHSSDESDSLALANLARTLAPAYGTIAAEYSKNPDENFQRDRRNANPFKTAGRIKVKEY